MARIVLSTAGSGGDAFPFIPVARTLEERGHDVLLAAPPALVHVLQGTSVDLSPIGPFQGRDAVQRFGVFDEGLWGYRGLDHFWRMLLDGLDRTADELRSLVRGSDLVVTHVFHPAGAIAAEAEGVPFASLDLHPAFRPGRHRPPPGVPSVGGLLDATAWHVLRAAWRRRLDPTINHVRQQHGLAPRQDAALLGGRSDLLTIDLTEAWYSGIAPDSDRPATAVGYPYWDAPPRLEGDVEPARELLEARGPAVVITLGTALSMDPGGFYDLVLGALEQTSAGALVLGARQLTVPPSLRDRVLARPYLPLSAVLPHARGVVHHGGAGTTNAGLRFGAPAVVVPRCFDQRYHATRVAALGAGVVVPWRRLTADRLADSINTVLTDGTLRDRAQAAAHRLASEASPAARAADAIDLVLADR